ncbi:phenylalanine--tRNA ligase subunit beta, partial [Halobacteriales archaeon QH_10_67_13]
DRLDRLSVEGIARSLRYHYGTDRGVYLPDTNDPEWTIEVDPSVPPERPYVTGAVVRGLDLDDEALASLIQLQEKLHATIGRGRAKGAIGVHDLTMLKGAAVGGEKSIRYTGLEPDGDTFVPLDGDAELTPAEVLTEHPVGETYADLVGGLDRYPAIYDAIGLFSFPPVINGRRTEVSTASRELFIEMTGTDQWTIDRMLNVVCYALSARGGQLEAVEVRYDEAAAGERAGRTVERPDLAIKHKTVAHDRIESVLGVELDEETVIDAAERAGLDAVADGEAYEVTIPPYRVDVLHPLDVIDDIGRARGFNDLEPRSPDLGTVGGRHERSRLEDTVRESLIGLGFEDMLNFHLVGRAENFDRMGLDPSECPTDVLGGGRPVRIREPYSEAYEILRTWALPSLVMVLENNTHRAYPQHLAEIGFAAELDDEVNTGAAERRTVAAVLADSEATYEDARGRVQALVGAFGKHLETPPTEHPSFIDGRTAAIVVDGETVGVVGELHPEVLVEHDIELPVAAFEFRLDALA